MKKSGRFKKGNIPPNIVTLPKKEILHLIRSYKSGSSKAEIAKRLKVSVTPITRILLENKVKLRNTQEVNKLTAQKNPPWNKGKKFPEISKKLRGKKHPWYGKPPWNKGKKGIQVAWNKGLSIKDPRVKKIVDQLRGRSLPKQRRAKISRSVKKLMTDEHKKKISVWTKKGMTDKVRERISNKKKKWIKENPELARKYMEPWVNSGTYGYGTYSIASDGHKCHSSHEKLVDEKLTKHKLPHRIHPPIPNSTKYADFLVNGIYIEVDGMSKNSEKDWNGKLKLYRKNNLKFIIIKPKDNIDNIIRRIKNGRINPEQN